MDVDGAPLSAPAAGLILSRPRATFAGAFALLALAGGCRWEKESAPSFRRPASADSAAIFTIEIDPGPEVQLRAGHGFLSTSDPWVELGFEARPTTRLLLSGYLPEATRESPPGRTMRIVAASSTAIVLEVRLIHESGVARSALAALPGGDAETLVLLAPETWRSAGTTGGVSRARGARDDPPRRFEIRDVPGPWREPAPSRVRLTLPASLAEGALDPPPFLARVAGHLEAGSPRAERVEAAWRGASAGAALAHHDESRTRAAIREEAVESRRSGSAAFDTSFAVDPAPETTLGAAVLVACLETGGRLPGLPHLASTYANRIPPEFLPRSVARALAHVRAGILPPRSGLALLDPGPSWDEDTGARPRAIVWGLLFPGDPYRAASAAERDASITHTGPAIDDARFAAALVAASLAEPPPDAAAVLDLAESFLGRGSEAENVVAGTRETWARTRSADSTAAWIEATVLPRAEERHPTQPWSQALPNLALTVLALEDGDGDYSRTIRLASSFGLDADANAALCGASIGARRGLAAIPDEVREPVGDDFRTAVTGAGNWRLSRFADVVVAASRAMHFDPAAEPR